MDILIGKNNIELSDRESRLLKEIHFGRLRLETHCTDLRSLNNLKRHDLIFIRQGHYRPPRNSADISRCVRTGIMMVADEELHLSVQGMSAVLQIQAIERAERAGRSVTSDQPVPPDPSGGAPPAAAPLLDSNAKDQSINTPS